MPASATRIRLIAAALFACATTTCEDAPEALPSAPSNLTTGIVVFDGTNFTGRSAHIQGDVADVVDEFGTTATVSLSTGFGFMAGTGWDVYLGRRFWLTPAINFRYGRPGDLVLAGRTRVPNWKHNMVDVTVGVKFD